MESETPPPNPTLQEQATQQLNPLTVLPASPSPLADVPYPHYSEIGANSNRLHNRFIRSLSLHMQLSGAYFFLRVRNTLKVYNQGSYLAVLGTNRLPNQALITVSNHQSTIDDPGLLAAVTPYKVMSDIHAARWGWCAREMCFPSKFTGWFFLHGKIVPIIRGLGLYQRGMLEAEEHIAQGGWMHVFPEGKCIPIPSGVAQLRWGVGKLIADAYRRSERCEQAKREWVEMQQHMQAASSSPSPSASFSSAASAAAASSSSSSSSSSTAAPSSSPRYPVSRIPPLSPSSVTSSSVCPLPPLVFPMLHHGMTRVMPFYHSIPKSGHTVRCLMGEKSLEFGDLMRFHEKNRHN